MRRAWHAPMRFTFSPVHTDAMIDDLMNAPETIRAQFDLPVTGASSPEIKTA